MKKKRGGMDIGKHPEVPITPREDCHLNLDMHATPKKRNLP